MVQVAVSLHSFCATMAERLASRKGKQSVSEWHGKCYSEE